jgi:cytoskeletal protein CcmA (bactofilin family)
MRIEKRVSMFFGGTMLDLSKIKVFLLTLAILLALFNFDTCFATEFKAGGNLSFSDTLTIHDDLIIAGNEIISDGNIEGDLISASSRLVQNGMVEGNLMACAKDLDISGQVNNSVRIFAQSIKINGKINRNLIAFCSTLNIKPDAEIGGDVTAFCGEFTLDGKIGKGLRGSVGTLIISGIVNGDVSVKADEITLMPTAKILGDFKYKSKNQAKIESGAQVTGQTLWTKELKKEKKAKSIFTAKSLIIETLFLLALMITGIVLTLIFKKKAYQAKRAVTAAFLKSLGWGLVFIICIPIAIIFLIVTILGIPIAIISLFAYAVLIYIAKIPVATALGEKIIKALGKQGEPSLIPSMLLGFIILTVLLNIPYLEWLIYFVVLFTGFGAILTSQKQSTS